MKILTRKQAIDEKCRDCIYDSSNGGTSLSQIENCTMEKSCALWIFRPVTLKLRNERKAEKYKLMSDSEKAAYDKKVSLAKKRFSELGR